MILGMSAWVFWLLLAAVLIVIEALTVNLVSIWFALGALSGMIAALLGANVLTQVIIAVVVSVIALAVILIFKPFDNFKHKRVQATNSDRVIGQQAVVVGRIDPLEGGGLVRVMGQMWSAVSADDGAIETGEHVIVKGISGVKLIVEKQKV